MLFNPVARKTDRDCGFDATSRRAAIATFSKQSGSLSASCLAASVSCLPCFDAMSVRSRRLWRKALSGVESTSDSDGQISDPSTATLFVKSVDVRDRRTVMMPTGRLARGAWKAMTDDGRLRSGVTPPQAYEIAVEMKDEASNGKKWHFNDRPPKEKERRGGEVV
jgi:hypothetical protein